MMKLRVLRGRGETAPATEPAPGPSGPTPPWRRLLRLPQPREVRAALRRNPGLKVVSLLLAFLLWFTINQTERDFQTTLEVPLAVRSLAPGLIVTGQPSKPIAIQVRGPRTILDGIDERKERMALNLSDKGAGEIRVELSAEMLRPELPRRLKVVSIDPMRVKVRVERLSRQRLPIKVELDGMPPLGYTAEPSVVPSEVEVSGPASKVDNLKEIKTEPVAMHGAPEPIERNVFLSWAGEHVSFTPDRVTVAVTFQPTMMVRRFEHVDVVVRGLPDALRAKLIPPRVDLTVTGPQRVLTTYELPDGSVYVDASALGPGSHRVTPKTELPQSLEVTRREPEVQRLEISAPRGER